MGKEKSLLGVVEAVRQLDWTRRTSPVIFSVLILIGLAALATALEKLGITLSPEFYAIVFLVLDAGAIGRWLYLRWYKPFDRKMLSVGFALQPDEASKPFHKEIMAALRRDLTDNGLNEVVQIRPLPSDLSFSSPEDAERYLLNKGLRVLIWGDTTRATTHEQDVSVFNVRFSCQHRVKDPKDKDVVISSMNDGARRGKWEVQDTNSLEGIKMVSGNLIEVSAYVLAICLWSVREIEYVEKAAKILDNLRGRLATRDQDENFPNLRDFKAKIDKQTYAVYGSITSFYAANQDYKTAKQWAEKVYLLNPNSYDANMYLARISWELGDRSAARNYTRAARKLKPKESLPYLNLAFFQFYEGSYSKALAIYKKLKPNVLKTNIIDVIDFLEREFDKTHYPSLLFAAAWLSFHYGDAARARDMFQNFLGLTKGKGSFDKLRNEAQSLLAA